MFYSHYNSIISEGQRVRRMRRTQLSAEKVNVNQRKQQTLQGRSNSNQRSKSCRSLPKVQNSSQFALKCQQNKKTKKKDIQNEYYQKGKKIQITSQDIEKDFYRQVPTPENPPKRFSKVERKADYSSPVQQYAFDHQQCKLNSLQKNHSPRSHIEIVKRSIENLKQSQEEKKQSNDDDSEYYGIYPSEKPLKESLPSRKQSNQYYFENSQLKREQKKSKVKSNVSKEYQFVLDKNEKPSKRKTKQIQKFSDSYTSFSKEDVSKIVSKPSNFNFYESSSKFHKNSNPSFENSSRELNVQESDVSDRINQSKSKFSQKSLSQINQKYQEESKKENQSQACSPVPQNHKVIKIAPVSRGNLPLASREMSQRDSVRQESVGNCLDQILERIQIHDYITSLFSDFAQQTRQFYENQSEQFDKVCFLLEKKHFYEKSRMIRALKGGKNIFQLSSIEIPPPILNNYFNDPEILSLCKHFQESNKMIFRALQKRINELKPYHKGDNLITIETETDNFSKYIAIDLHKELQELYPSLEDDDLSEELVERYQDRIIDIMEKIFLLSEFNGRKVKKLEFSEEIEDFDAYYENNFANLVAAIEYFEEM